ncbi:c-type cytochrome [Paraburkholderia rhizosphaerae]|uniref:Cytochrome c n=1 Tax=Paraburkholderia rhizosphaerae TaxID=480658 RepID=A0A4R8LMJ0_9BURK|nr:c-type cytochrome [Paraburkholderia rhizosphaerae]TDY44418.1 cytochrome c [Paraburkholderia rhizosphaerae]
MKSKAYAAMGWAGALALAVAWFGPAARAEASPGLALARQENCLSCHSVNRHVMGPSLHDIAARYAARSDASQYLAHKIVEGSTGVWGKVPMPANTQVTPDEAAQLASWILSLK